MTAPTTHSPVSGIPLISAWFDTLPDAMLLCAADFTILAANGKAVELLQARAADLLFKNAREVLPPYASAARFTAAGRTDWRSERFLVSGRMLHAVPPHANGWMLTLEHLGPRAEPPGFIGRAPATRELLEFVSRVAGSRATSILLQGESGTGKELVARRLHALSPRGASNFVPINCAALPESLLEAELFGFEKGAFTGAHSCKSGLLEVADGGTVFLDEIAELSMPLQAKLLRVLEDHSFRRIGGTRVISPDLRVICATNADLLQSIEEHRFRSDLYYRLSAVQIQLPALRERVEDIPLLAMHFLEYFNRQHRRAVHGIHPTAQRMLELHTWPGNVRELRNVIERAVLLETGARILPARLALSPAKKRPPPAETTAPFSLRSGERELIGAALADSGGNQSQAARLLGIGRFSLRYKMKKLGML